MLPTLYDGRTNHARTVLETISETYDLDVIEPPIPKTIKFAEAPAAGRSILATSRSSKGAKAYREVADEPRRAGPTPDRRAARAAGREPAPRRPGRAALRAAARAARCVARRSPRSRCSAASGVLPSAAVGDQARRAPATRPPSQRGRRHRSRPAPRPGVGRRRHHAEDDAAGAPATGPRTPPSSRGGPGQLDAALPGGLRRRASGSCSARAGSGSGWSTTTSEVRAHLPRLGQRLRQPRPRHLLRSTHARDAVGVDDSGTMQYFVRFTQGDTGAAIGFHAIPVDDGGRADQGPARHAASHGCIRQKRADASRCGSSRRSARRSSSPPERQASVASARVSRTRRAGLPVPDRGDGDGGGCGCRAGRSAAPTVAWLSACGRGAGGARRRVAAPSSRLAAARALRLRSRSATVARPGALARPPRSPLAAARARPAPGRRSGPWCPAGCPGRGRGARRWSRSPAARRTAGRAPC